MAVRWKLGQEGLGTTVEGLVKKVVNSMTLFQIIHFPFEVCRNCSSTVYCT